VNWIQVAQWRGSFEHGNERSGSIKDGKFIKKLGDYQLLEKDSL
jgi:hypothetical protein